MITVEKKKEVKASIIINPSTLVISSRETRAYTKTIDTVPLIKCKRQKRRNKQEPKEEKKKLHFFF